MDYNEVCYSHDLKVYKSIYFELKNGVISEDSFINEKEFRKLYQRNREKKKKYSKWFRKCIEKYNLLYFVTLTFNNDYICSEEEAVKLLSTLIRSLRPLGIECRFNVDYGEDFGRLHFHGVSNVPFEEYWKYGFSKDKIINLTSESVTRVTAYVNKIVNHAFKSTTRGRVIRSYTNDGRKKKCVNS